MELLALLLVGAFLAAVILPWINQFRIGQQNKEIEALRSELSRLKDRQAPAKPVATQVAKPATAPPAAAMKEVPPPLPRRDVVAAILPPTASASSEPAQADFPVASETRDQSSQDWFSKIAVWVGGIALLMAGFYMIKYSIDSGWMTPRVRVWLTTVFGFLLCGAGLVISSRARIAANERIGQALSGAGIACLYFAAYACVHLYGFLSPMQGFAAMVAVTLLAVVLSLKNGAPIALMGLVGGFLTPWLMQSDFTDTGLLFSYLFLLFCGAQYLCARRGWWGLLLGSLGGAYLWVILLLADNLNGASQAPEGALPFILGICLVNSVWVVTSKQLMTKDGTRRLLSLVRILVWGGGLLLSLPLVWMGGFAGVDMTMFGVLSIGALVLSVLREKEFHWAAWFSLAAVAMGAVSNTSTYWASWLLWPIALFLLTFAVGHWRGLRQEQIVAWRVLSVSALLLIAPVLYLNREVIQLYATQPEWLWLFISLTVGGLLLLAGEHLYRRERSLQVLGEYSAFAVLLFGFGIWTYVSHAYLAHSLSLLFIASAIYWKVRALGRTELILGGLAVIWFAAMYSVAGEAIAYFFREVYLRASDQNGIAALAWGLGIFASALTLTLFRRDWGRKSRQLLVVLCGVVFVLGLIGIYQWLAQSWMPAAWPRPHVEGGLTASLAIVALACGIRPAQGRESRLACGMIASLVAVRIFYLHLFDAGASGESFFLNALFLQFGVPCFVAFALAWFAARVEVQTTRRVYQIAAMLLGFIWSSFLVKDYFGGARLFDGRIGSSELYAYSVVWLLLAILYQAIGLWRNQKAIHIGSLLLLLLTVGKVFLIDASELEGLFRVLSFLGLGVALIGIGFYYNQVVFGRQRRE